MWVDQLNQYPCGAGQCKVRTTKTTTNNGRKFRCSPRSTGVDNPGCRMFEWLDTTVFEQGGSTTHAISELGECSQQTGESSQTTTLNTASGTSTSPAYLRGYLRGAIRANAQNSRVYEELLEAVEKLELKNPEERTD